MKYDKLLNNVQTAGMAITLLCVNACSQAPDAKPKHVWSEQVEALHEAKEVANYANELQAIQDERLRERNSER